MLPRDPIPVDLFKDNQELRRRLDELVAHARHNERVLARVQEMELRLIGAAGLPELLDVVLAGTRDAFSLETVTLALLDPEYEVRRMLESLGYPSHERPGLILLDACAPLPWQDEVALAPVLGAFDAARHGGLYPSGVEPPVMVALLPLVRGGRLIGSLNLGSRSAERFQPGLAADFLARIAAVTAICVENVINNERLKHLGLTDPLTGVHNRRYFDQRVREELDRSRRLGAPLNCLLLDVDHFKAVNDAHGHQVGDWVLREVASRIKAQLRLSDALARYGGEEFAVLLSQTDTGSAVAIAERIRQSIVQRPFQLRGWQSISVALSIGIAAMREVPGTDRVEALADDLVARADAALYKAKRAGRNRVVAAGP
ncbi:MAG: sensor domain-containing diguanylate cyclase [Betaproteobacteria bacterium]|nr:sensor domain-containing diguanylate cyclase [Betaproteobacteria bacterium]